MGQQEEYAKALDLLDSMRASGQVSENEYQLKRTRLIEEAQTPRQSRVLRFVGGIVIGIVVLIVLAAALRIINS